MPQDQDDIKGADAMKQAPTPGPLDSESVKLLVKGDYVRGPNGKIYRLEEWGDGGFLTFIDEPHDGYLATLCAFIGRPGADGWMPWSGGRNPVGSALVDIKVREPVENGNYVRRVCRNAQWAWAGKPSYSGDIIAFRLAPTAPVEASGSEREEVDFLKSALAFAYEKGLHEIGYDPIERILALHPQPSVSELARAIADGFFNGNQGYDDCNDMMRLSFDMAAEAVLKLRPQPSGETRDFPAEFEAWWKDYKHRNRENADYWLKKQIAFDAFYFAALSPSAVASGGQHSSGEGQTARTMDAIDLIAKGLYLARGGTAGAYVVEGGEASPFTKVHPRINAVRKEASRIVMAERTALSASPVAPVAETAGEAVAWHWTEAGSDTDGDPKRVRGTYGDYEVNLTLSRRDRMWSAVVNRGNGKSGFATQGEAKAYAVSITERLLSARMKAARRSVALYVHTAQDDDKLRRAVEALDRLTAPHVDEDGIIDPDTASSIVGRGMANEDLKLKGSFMAALGQGLKALAALKSTAAQEGGE